MADEEEYLQLRDLKIGLDHESLEGESDFSLCLWLYFSASASPSSIIICQVCFLNSQNDFSFEIDFFLL